ncbi:hypothetical protein [Butyrivibrio sp. WCD2001]|uniref:hypothetical protein n=1 Tax=Butyrivibrio sp. WCD2001 TaxID=1280681 RepID=UPI0003F5BF0A|nr:hypothetical protein [Butyrivibrio sp. WCD2001]
MSVESNFLLRCQDEKQIEVAKSYPVNLNGRGQNYPIAKKMEVMGNDIELYNCLCIDDFEKYLIDWCIYIAENTPDLRFDAHGGFTVDTDGYTVIHKINYENATLTIETSSGYEEYEDEEDEEDEYEDDEYDEDWDEESGMSTSITVYKLIDGKLILSE